MSLYCTNKPGEEVESRSMTSDGVSIHGADCALPTRTEEATWGPLVSEIQNHARANKPALIRRVQPGIVGRRGCCARKQPQCDQPGYIPINKLDIFWTLNNN